MANNIADLLIENKTFGIQYLKAEKPISMPSNHYHEHYEIYYQLSGERYYFIQDRTYLITKGDLVIINAYDLHRTTKAGTTSYERILINFKKDFLSGFIENINDLKLLSCFNSNISILRLNINEQNFVEGLLRKMMEEEEKQVYGFNTYLKTLLIELLIFINRSFINPKHNSFEYPNPLHKKISEIVKYINTNYSQNLTLDNLSKEFFISPYYLSRAFKKVTGFTFIEYLNNVRIKEAQRLLRESKLNITQISEKVGFESPTHFGRVFKNITGVSPLKYKKALLGI